MVLASIISGGGAPPKQDGWRAVAPERCFGALTSGDIELLEHSYPIVIHRYSLMTVTGGAGTTWEIAPLNGDMMCIGFVNRSRRHACCVSLLYRYPAPNS